MKPGILLLGNYPPPFGGVPSHVRDVSNYFAARGWQVHVVPGKTHRFGIEHPEDGVTVYRYRRPHKVRALLTIRGPQRGLRQFFPHWRNYLAHLGLCKLCLDIIRSRNIKVISAYHIFGAATIGAWLSRETGVPLITTVFGEIYQHTLQHWQRSEEVDFVAAHTARWLSCSRYCARSLALLRPDWEAEPLIYGIDVRHFRPGLDALRVRARYGWGAQDPVVLFVGRMNGEMGLDSLMQVIPLVLQRQPQTKFLLVGARGHLTDKVLWVAGQHPGSVAVETDVPYEELPLFYAAASLAVAPSSDERACLGLAIAEAMACGRAVIGCRVGGTSEVLVDNETGFLVPPRDLFGLADAIVKALGQPALLEEMGRRGRARAEQLFDRDIMNRQFEAIVAQVVARRAAPGTCTP
jgi:glycosyltransferase involved in cell wall biosynthesis